MIELFLLMVAAHALSDYPLQGDFLAKAKNHTAPIAGVPFYQALGAHSAIHAGFVGVITGSIWLGLAEFIVHVATDYAKCDGRISYNTDQAIHIICKAAWVFLLWWFG